MKKSEALRMAERAIEKLFKERPQDTERFEGAEMVAAIANAMYQELSFLDRAGAGF